MRKGWIVLTFLIALTGCTPHLPKQWPLGEFEGMRTPSYPDFLLVSQALTEPRTFGLRWNEALEV